MRTILASAAALALTTLNAYAVPPEGAKASEIVAKIEQTPDVQYVAEIDWNDRGYYEVKYMMKNGAEAKIKIDPRTGATVR